MTHQTEKAEDLYRAAFERLKEGRPNVLKRGAQVSQNNVAREAGREPDAFKKARYPTLIREIRAYVEIHEQRQQVKSKRVASRHRRETWKETAKRFKTQRDAAQSRLVNAHNAVLTLIQEKAELQRRLDEFLPPPSPLR